MKHLKKFIAAALTMFVALAMAVPAFAAAGTPATGTITITPPDNATGENTYEIYKVFDATVNEDGSVAYKLLDGLTDADVPTGFTAVRGYITEAPDALDEQASALAAYTHKELADTVTTNGTTPGTSKSLAPGYYYIETSTGTAVYVNAGGNISIKDKNVITTVKKSAGTEYSEDALKAIAAVGTDQDFTAVITKGKGATKVVFTDTMTNMTFNDDLVITATPAPVKGTDYTVTPTAGNAGFTVTFTDAYIARVADDDEITLNYSGKITSDALTVDPATNTAKVTSGENNENTSDSVEVYNATITVNKLNGNNQPLAGAKFQLKNADDKYYGGTDQTTGAINWVDKAQAVEVEAVKVGDDYVAEFKGLKDGAYTLIESTVPQGYNKAADLPITIAGGDYTEANLKQTKQVINETGTVLPSTGGMGTTILYVIGGILVIGGGIYLLTKKRMGSQQ